MRYVIRLGIFDRGQAKQAINDVEFAPRVRPDQKRPGLAYATETRQPLPSDDLFELPLRNGRSELDDHMSRDMIRSPVDGLSVAVDARLLGGDSDDRTDEEDG